MANKIIPVHNSQIVQRSESIFATQFTGVKNIFRLSKDEELKSFGLKQPAYMGIRPENIYIHHQFLTTYYRYQGKINSFKNNGIYMEIELSTTDIKRNYISYLTLNRFFELKLKKDTPIHFCFNKKDLIVSKL